MTQESAVNKPPRKTAIKDEDPTALFLKAEDRDDVAHLSTLLQDALVHASAMHYNPDAQLFSMLTNRFCWEHPPEAHPDHGEDVHKRRHASVNFSHVHDVKHQGLKQRDLSHVHSLTGIELGPKGDHLLLHFAGGEVLKLSIEKLLCHLSDLDHAWFTPRQPRHGHEDEA